MVNYEQDSVQSSKSDINGNVVPLDQSGYLPFFEIKWRNRPIDLIKDHELIKKDIFGLI